MLKDRQDANKVLDIKKNLLLASGILKDPRASVAEIESAYEKVQATVIDLETGEEVPDMDPKTFNQVKAAKDPKTSKRIPSEQDYAGIKRRSKYSVAYKYLEDDQVQMLILPVNGKGLWSTLYGFLALTPDTETIKGIGFYQHGETPGLGGEVDNPRWKAQWAGKKPFDDDFNEVEFRVIKGTVGANDPDKEHKVDGLSGATITANGVTGLVKYWLGDDGFGPYLEKQRALYAGSN